MLKNLFPGLFGGSGVVETALHLFAILFLACAFLPIVRTYVFGFIDKIRAMIRPQPAPAATLDEIAKAVAKELKQGS